VLQLLPTQTTTYTTSALSTPPTTELPLPTTTATISTAMSTTNRQVIDQNFLSGVLVVEPHVTVRPEVNFKNILRAAFAPISFQQKITITKEKVRKTISFKKATRKLTPEEQVNGDVPRQRVEGRLPEAGDDGSLALDGHDLGEEALGRIDGWMVDLKAKKNKFKTGFITSTVDLKVVEFR